MFPNLEMEQARSGYSDSDIAEKLGISRRAYRMRKESGTFLLPEAETLLAMYGKPFEYLFEGEG